MARLLKWLLLATALLAVAAVTLPWWLGLVLRPIARSVGAHYAGHERVGYGRFRLVDVRVAVGRGEIRAARLEADTPLRWAWRRASGGRPVVLIEDWEFAPGPVATPAPAGPVPDSPAGGASSAGPATVEAAARSVLPQVAAWLPVARLESGRVPTPAGEIRLGRIDWDFPTLAATGVTFRGHEISLNAAPAAAGRFHLALRWPEADASADLAWAPATRELHGAARVWSQPLELSASFPPDRWLPRQARLDAAAWDLPADRLQLGPEYARVEGSASAAWDGERLQLQLDARAHPRMGSDAPPLVARTRAAGSVREITIDELQLDAPFARARLSAPLTLSLDRPPAPGPVTLALEADLARIPGLTARGRVTGEVEVAADDPVATQVFRLESTELAVAGLDMPRVRTSGRLRWPRLELAEVDVALGGGHTLSARGQLDLATREILTATVDASLAAGGIDRWLPSGWHGGAATIRGQLSGPLRRPVHAGTLKLAGLQAPGLHPVAASVKWSGSGSEVEVPAAELAAAGGATIRLAGAIGRQRGKLERLEFPAGDVAWSLAAPVEFGLAPAWSVGPLALEGPQGRLAFAATGGSQARFSLEARGFDSAWLNPWIELPGPRWQLEAAALRGAVVDGHLGFEGELTTLIETEPESARVGLRAAGDAQGVTLHELIVRGRDRVLTRASGRLPVSVAAGQDWSLVVDETAPLELSATTDPDSPLWSGLADFAGVTVVNPEARVELRGTLAQPGGTVSLRANRLSATPGRALPGLPELAEVTVAAEARRDALAVTRFSARVDGQPLEASGGIAMGEEDWRRLRRDPAGFDWRRFTGRVSLRDADIGPAVRRYLPQLSPQGRLGAELEFTGSGRVTGAVRLTGAATRPLTTFGSLQEIAGELRLDGRRVTLTGLSARLGGEPVTLRGSVDFPENAPPRLALRLQGDNLPLVRTPGLLVRTDLDLQAETDGAGVTTIRGTVNARDALVLADLGVVFGSAPRGVARRPPYFAVEAPPYDRWRLDVALRGERAVRIRTTVLTGTATPRFQLAGTLAEPRALGQLSLDEGRVLFPFATFEIQQAALRVTAADPHVLQLSALATARRHGHDLQLEAGGTVAAPMITFSSNPPLDAADIFLLVSTGRLPAEDTAGLTTAQRLARYGTLVGRGLFQTFAGDRAERIEISFGEQVSELGRETYRIDYRLNERWQLTGEYDEYDNYNVGVRWRALAPGREAADADAAR